MKSAELKWGLIIGLAGMIWLYASCFLGLHEKGLIGIQVVTLVSLILTFLGFLFGLRAVRKREEGNLSYIDGLRSGAVIAGISAVLAALTQLGYFQFVNPGWTDYMVEQTRLHFADSKLNEEEMTQQLELARKSFSLKNYLLQAALGAIVLGLFFSAIIMLFLRKRKW